MSRRSTFCTWLKRQLQQRRSLYIGGSLLILSPGVVCCGDSTAPVDTLAHMDSAIVDTAGDRGSSQETPIPDKATGETGPDISIDTAPSPDLGVDSKATSDGPVCNPSTPGQSCVVTQDCPADLVCIAPICIIPCPPSCQPLPCDPANPDKCALYDATCEPFCGSHQCMH